jgi:hypothetical protein
MPRYEHRIFDGIEANIDQVDRGTNQEFVDISIQGNLTVSGLGFERQNTTELTNAITDIFQIDNTETIVNISTL